MAINQGFQSALNRLLTPEGFANTVLPIAGIIESIASKGQSPGTVATQQRQMVLSDLERQQRQRDVDYERQQSENERLANERVRKLQEQKTQQDIDITAQEQERKKSLLDTVKGILETPRAASEAELPEGFNAPGIVAPGFMTDEQKQAQTATAYEKYDPEAVNKMRMQKDMDPLTQMLRKSQADKAQADADKTRAEIPFVGKPKPTSAGAGGAVRVNVNGLTQEENAALNDAIVNGLDPYAINSRTAKIFAQQEIINPGRKWNELGAQAKFERSTGTMNTKALLNSVNPLFDSLLSAGKALGNSNIQFMNKAINLAKEATGDPKIVQFNNQRDDLVAEIERGLLGSGVLSDTKYMRAIKNVNSAQSYPQLEAAVRATKLVIDARLEALRAGPNPNAGMGEGTKNPAIKENPVVDPILEKAKQAVMSPSATPIQKKNAQAYIDAHGGIR